MLVQRTRHTRAYVQIPNDLAQRSDMSLEALGLLVKLLSYPDRNCMTAEKIVARVTNGRRTVANALNELGDLRYYHRARVQDPETKRWVTLTAVTDIPTDHMPTVGEPTDPAVGNYPKGKDAEQKTSLPVEPEEQPEDCDGTNEGEGEESAPQRTDGALTERAVKTLHRLGIHDTRLLLSDRECARLAPLAMPWLAAGFHEMEVIRALTVGLPAEIASAAALVTFRLKNHQPERTPALKPFRAPSQSVKRERCPECEVIFPLGHPGGICRNCR